MKTLLALLVVSLTVAARGQTLLPAEEALKKAEALQGAGNYRDAADVAKQHLASTVTADGKTRASLLKVATESFRNLGAPDEAEMTAEQAAKDFANDWLVLLQVGVTYFQLPHHGMEVDGKFTRGNSRNRGAWKSVTLRDRTRMLQLLEAARLAMPANAGAEEQAQLLDWIVLGLGFHARNFHAAWKLQALTDLSKQPGYDDEEGADESVNGYPVDEKGEPVFFQVPAAFEAAASDGERLMWLLTAKEKLGGQRAGEARRALADYLANWFSVRSLASFGWGRASVNESQNKAGIAALHTLTDEETVAKLATGPRRFALPDAQNFLKRYQALADDEALSRSQRAQAFAQIADELTNRRQYPRAATNLRRALELETDADTAKRLREQLEQITNNLARLEPLPPQPAGKGAKLSLVFRNATKISFTARKVDVLRLIDDTKAWLRTEPQDREDWWRGQVSDIGRRLLEKDQEKYLGPVVAQWETLLEPAADHWDKRIEIATALQTGGAYFIEGKVEQGNTARALLWIEDLVLVEARQKNQRLFCLADAVTGAPVADATVSFFGYRQDWKDAGIFNRKPRYNFSFKEFSEQPDAAGMLKASAGRLDDDYQWLQVARDARGRLAFSGFERFYFSDYEGSYNENGRIYLVTDRPVYRPAQTVKWKAWARAATYDPKAEHNRWAGKTFEVVITNPRGEKVFEKNLEADASGAVTGELPLAEDATLGNYGISLAGKRDITGGHSFRVEEYKKPEFEVKVDAPGKPVALGETFEVKVKADYYFGGPVKEGKVKYRIERTQKRDRWFPGGRWDWLFGEGYGWRTYYYDWYPGAASWCRCIPPLPWLPWRSDPPELVASGEQVIGADGTITVKVDTALAKEMHGDQDHAYEITAEVTDQSRRTIFGNGTVLAARRPYEVYVWLDRGYYQAGEAGTIRLAAKTLDGRAVKAGGKIRVLKVTYDANGKPVEKEAAAFDVRTDEDGEGMQQVKWDKAGQYRVSIMLKDEAGHEIEGVAFTTVRGDDFQNGKGLRFDDLELAVQKDEYAPGEEVEVLVNAARDNARVALFIRAANGLYPDPVWLQLDGRSASHRFKITEKDQPNIFIEAFTVSDAKVHRVTRQIVVPPSKHIATVDLVTDKKEYLPQQKPAVKLRVKDQHGQPFIGDVILTGYDKALEYISGGSNQSDIRKFFWGWKRDHSPAISDTLRECEVGMAKPGEKWMQALGFFGHTADSLVDPFAAGAVGGAMGFAMSDAGAPKAPVMAPASAAARGGVLRQMFKAKAETRAAAAPLPSEGGTDGPQPMIRTNLADSAVWITSVKTNAQGEAALDFALPDNLTTWNLRSWVMGPQTQVGEAKVEIVTRKNLMVRLQAPRFFVEKDEVTISANIHNEMDQAQDVKAVLELDGGTLALLESTGSTSLSVPSHGEKRVDWKVKAVSPGEAVIRVKALAEADSDAMEMKFPVFVHGALKTDSWSLALRPGQGSGQIKLHVPEQRRPEATRLEVRYSPTLAMALVDALPYLADYPYGCTEQTLNRFVPTVITLGVLRDLGVDLKAVREKQANLNAQEIGDPQKRRQRWQTKDHKGKPKQPVFNEDEVARMARAGLQRLEAMRNGDGGWGWFPGGRESSEHITAIVLHGLQAARQAGMQVSDGLIEPGIEFLKAHEAEQLRRLQLPEKHEDHKPHPDNLDALVHTVLVEQRKGEKQMRERLYEHRLKLSRYNQAQLGLACDAVGEKTKRDMLLRNLRQFVKEDDENQTAYLDLAGGSWWYWYDDEIETQAAFLKLLVTAEPKGEQAARLAKYLLNNRRNGTYWNSTKDTAAVIGALAAFVKASGEREPLTSIEVHVDGKMKKRVQVTKENLFTFDGTLLIEGEDLGSGEHMIEIKNYSLAASGSAASNSPLYLNAYLTVFSKEEQIPAAGLEVKVRRTFYKLVEEKRDTQVAGARGQVVGQQGFKYSRIALASDAEVKSGDLVEVELSVESKNDYEYVLIEDFKPAGYEPVEVRSGWNWEGLQSYQEFRDEKVAFFAERLPRGTHNLSYRVKAEIPGRFSALPTKVEAMYAPELKGNADEWKARVVER